MLGGLRFISMRIELMLLAVLWAAPLVGLAAEPSPLDEPGLPSGIDVEREDPVLDAARVWRLGHEYLEGPRATDAKFAGVNVNCASLFLTGTHFRPVVQFSCAVSPAETEDALTACVEKSEDPLERLQALVVLVKAEAPSSVEHQWQALQALKKLDAKEKGKLWTVLLEEIEARFSDERILKTIGQDPPADQYDSDNRAYYWAIRAAGVRHSEAALERVKVLSRSVNLYASLAAEKSLGEYPGKAGDEGLAYCLTGWRYNAANKAGFRLAQRNPQMLVQTLTAAKIPEDFRWQAGLLYAMCDRAEAVPLLCASVGGRAIIDRDMFDQIARLTTKEQLDLVVALPDKVRPEQREKAQATLAKVRERLKLQDPPAGK